MKIIARGFLYNTADKLGKLYNNLYGAARRGAPDGCMGASLYESRGAHYYVTWQRKKYHVRVHFRLGKWIWKQRSNESCGRR